MVSWNVNGVQSKRKKEKFATSSKKLQEDIFLYKKYILPFFQGLGAGLDIEYQFVIENNY